MSAEKPDRAPGLKALSKWFSLEGRANRREFNLVGLPLLAWIAVEIVTLEILAPHGIRNLPLMLTGFFLLVSPFALIIPAIARRLHDLGLSAGWLFALTFAVKLFRVGVSHIPDGLARSGAEAVGVGIVFGLLLMLIFRKGQAGENQFGSEPLLASANSGL